jgi:hypothetical protein
MSDFTDILNLSGSALSISFENKYLGANYGSYAKSKTISFRGVLLPTGQYSGVKDTFSTYENILNSAHDSCSSNTEFVINGRNFGSGRVLSVSFEDRENPITVGSYNMELQIYDSGGFDGTQITSAFDGDVKDELEVRKPHLIESINESFSFDQGEDGGFSFSHEFSINFISGESGYDYVTAAKSIADHIIGDLSNEPDYGFVGEAAGYYNSANYTTAKHLYNENYNLVDLNFSFSKNYSTVGLQDSYIDQKQALTITRDDAGFYTVVENGDIRANENGGYSHLISALNEVVSGSRFAHRRCTAYFNSVNSTSTLLGGGALNDDLYSGHTQFGWNLDEEAEKINYNISFTNNPRFTSSGIHEYTQSLTEDKQAGTITVSENGSLRPYDNIGGAASAGTDNCKFFKVNFVYNASDGLDSTASPDNIIAALNEAFSDSTANTSLYGDRKQLDNKIRFEKGEVIELAGDRDITFNNTTEVFNTYFGAQAALYGWKPNVITVHFTRFATQQTFGAYAYFPSNGGKMAGQIVYATHEYPADINYVRYLINHEMGHVFGLSHTFSATCADDGVSDTPLTKENTTTVRSSECGEVSMNENFMDYVQGQTLSYYFFTQGQYARMHAQIETYMQGFYTENNCSNIEPFTISDNFAVIKDIVNSTSHTRAVNLAQEHYRNWKFTTHVANHSVLTFDNDLSLGDNLVFTKKNITYPAFGKQIDYSVELVIDGRKYSSGNLKDITVEVSDTEPTLIRSPQYVINFGEIIQNNNFAVGGTQNSSLGVRSVKVTAQKTRTSNYLTAAPTDFHGAIHDMLDVAYKQMLRMPTEINNIKLREGFVQNLNYTFNSDGKIDLTFDIGFVAEAWDLAHADGYVKLKSSSETTDSNLIPDVIANQGGEDEQN